MFTYYIRDSGFGAPEVIAWSYIRNNTIIDFESRVSGYYRARITDSPKYTKEQILKRYIKELGEVKTVKSEIRPSEVWRSSRTRIWW